MDARIIVGARVRFTDRFDIFAADVIVGCGVQGTVETIDDEFVWVRPDVRYDNLAEWDYRVSLTIAPHYAGDPADVDVLEVI